jgi:hypothetical protein
MRDRGSRPSGDDRRLVRPDPGRQQQRADWLRAEATRLRAAERAHPERGHTVREHLDVSQEQLALRARDGTTARGIRLRPPPHATRWQSDEACIRAADSMGRSADAQAQRRSGREEVVVRQQLRDAVGPDWRAHVYGRSHASLGSQESRWPATSQAVGVWRRQDDGQYHLFTCYPEVRPP